MTLLLLPACQPTLPLQPPPDQIGEHDTGDTGDTADTGEPEVLAEYMNEDDLWTHLEALAEIARENGDTRAWTSPGHIDSTAYVLGQLEGAGYTPWMDLHTYEKQVNEEVGLAIAGEEPWVYTEDYAVMSGSGSGELISTLTGVDLTIPPGEEANTSDSGCEAEDFAGFPAGDIALIQRGTCSFADKVQNALDAGAVAVLIFNEGQPGRREPVKGSLGRHFDVPVLGLSYELGAELAETTAELDIVLELGVEEFQLSNVIAELPGDDRVVLIGAHLDSVSAGPGLNDNASGSVVVLELALQLARLEVEDRPTVRFAWWDGEEYGLLGSYAYVESAGDELPDAYFNYDMVASPNGAPFIYDGDGSADEGLAPSGSAVLEYALQEGYEVQQLQWEETGPYVPTDSWFFLEAGVASSGIFTGAHEGLRQSLAETYGGDAAEAMDPCYHQLCDDLDNIHMPRMLEATKAAAHALQVVLEDPSAIGERGQPGPELAPVLPGDLPHCGEEGMAKR
ncbi:MAG TPA: M28 family peptidase [Myxococcota bacterium]|nr:M28 family peptidase [Myxococcota bacterium]